MEFEKYSLVGRLLSRRMGEPSLKIWTDYYKFVGNGALRLSFLKKWHLYFDA